MKKLFAYIFVPLLILAMVAYLSASPYVSGGGGGGTASAVTVAATTDTTTWVILATDSTGNVDPKVAAGLTFNATTGMLTATGFTGALTGTATGLLFGSDAQYDIPIRGASAYGRLATSAGMQSFLGLAVTVAGNDITFPGSVTTTMADNSRKITWQANTGAVAATASAYEAYIEGSIFRFNQNGTEYASVLGPSGANSAAQILFTGPTAARIITLPDAAITVARTDAGNTFTGVNVFTAPTFTTSIAPTAHDGTTIGTSLLGFSDIYLAAGAVIYAQDDESNTMTSAATGWTFAKPITVSDVTNDNYVKITNNAARAATASVNELYPEANIWKVNQNGTESAVCISPSAGQVSFTGPTAARAFALPDAAATVQVASACTALASDGAATALTVTTYTNCFTLTVDDNEDQTITFSGAGYAGQEITIIFTTAGTADEIITFHATLVSSIGTLTLGTDAGKFYTVRFISNGSHWYEVSRTAVQT